MLLIFLDTETTGLNPEKHRTLEIAFKIIDSHANHLKGSYESIVFQPREVWEMADQESFKINAFTWEEILKGKSEKTVASEVILCLKSAHLQEEGGVFICQNPSFDRAFFCQLINVDLQEQYGWPYHWLDLASMYWAVRLLHNKEDAKVLKEKDLSKDLIAEYYHLPAEGQPHRAMNGVNHLMACYERLFSSV